MKVLLILACLAFSVSYIQAQTLCIGRPLLQVCTGGLDEGYGNRPFCRFNVNSNMWFYNSADRRCEKMQYLGCGGNNNRYCSESHCITRCRP